VICLIRYSKDIGMWIQLLAPKSIEQHGVRKTYYPGDWVNVGKMSAQRWIAEGQARDPNNIEGFTSLAGFGVVAIGGGDVGILSSKKIEVEYGEPRLPWPKTLLWDPPVCLRLNLLPVGISLLDIWQVAVPLYDYDVLAKDVGSDEDRQMTANVVHDLRVPLYNPGMVFVRRCADTQMLIDSWVMERSGGSDNRLAFLRALYQTKPMVLALPTTWTGEFVPKEG